MKSTSLVLTTIAMALATITIAQQPGDLDTSFSGDGKQTALFGWYSDVGRSVAIQSDGKIVVAGEIGDVVEPQWAVIRFDAGGALDGKVITDFDTLPNGPEESPHSVAIQPDGKIVVAGSQWWNGIGATSDFALARYHDDGTLDSSFSTDGMVITDLGFGDHGFQMVLQPDGKLVVAGQATVNPSHVDFAMARYRSDGSLDSSFDADGKVITDFDSSLDYGSAVAIQADGRIVLAGQSDSGFAVARYKADGALDSTFSLDGKVTTAFPCPGYGFARSIAIQSDGRIVVAGGCGGYLRDFALARYNSDGSPDSSFSNDGQLTTAIGAGMDYVNSVVIQSDGKIVVAGMSESPTFWDFALARYSADGTLDSTFNADGKLTTDFAGHMDHASSMAIQSDGKIVVVGYASDATHAYFAVARYHSVCTPTTSNQSITTCQAYNWNGNILAISGTYSDTILNIGGCDSFMTLELTISPLEDSVTQVGNTLTANLAGATYQWVSCVHGWYTPINGATTQSFTATSNGSYAVIIMQNGCTDTSACYFVTGVGISEYSVESDASIYPNPTNGLLTVILREASAVDVEVRDVTGRVISTLAFQAGENINLSLGEAAGLYSILVTTAEHKQYRFKVVKE
jgi:uncharacterized delta-60 repeat protein